MILYAFFVCVCFTGLFGLSRYGSGFQSCYRRGGRGCSGAEPRRGGRRRARRADPSKFAASWGDGGEVGGVEGGEEGVGVGRESGKGERGHLEEAYT